MRTTILTLLFIAFVAAPFSAVALTPGTDVLVPAGARAGTWVTDLYIMNSGNQTATVTVYWLVRNQANPSPASETYSIAPGATLVLDDVIANDFGLGVGEGAFRVTSDQSVVVNSRIYSLVGGETFGQGFEGVPTSMATSVGETTSVVGLAVVDGSFRTNFYACAGADGAVIQVSLVDTDGTALAATKQKTLGAWMPFLKPVDTFVGSGDFTNGSLQVTVTKGSAVVGASKVDDKSGDPTTLESSVEPGMAAGVDGTYQFAIYDDYGYATGGNLTVDNGEVTFLDGTYTNWDKVDGGVDPVCTWILLFGEGLPLPTDLDDFETGVTFDDDYRASVPPLGIMTWTMQFEIEDGLSISGTIDAVGSEFPAENDGCNGTFPQLTLIGGKLPPQ